MGAETNLSPDEFLIRDEADLAEGGFPEQRYHKRIASRSVSSEKTTGAEKNHGR